MRGLLKLVREIHHRSLWQVLTIYVAGSWMALQVVGELTDRLGLPGWLPPLAISLLILHLPLVLATAFVQEGVAGVGGGDGGQEGGGDGGRLATPERASGRGRAMAGSEEAAGNARSRRTAAARPGSDGGPEGRTGRRYLTWGNVLRSAAAGFALFGLVTAGWATSRALGIGPAATLVSRGVMAEREPVVLAGFGNTTPDSLLGETVGQALRIDLLQSPTLTVLEPVRVAEVMQRMGRDPSAPLDLPIAREVAVREGVKAVITGQVRAAGTGYLLTAELVSAADGKTLVAVDEKARSAEALIDAIGRLSRKLRERVGEPLRSIRGGEPLARVSTASLEALKRYTAGLRAIEREGEFLRAATLLEQAVALDSTFAMAHRKLGVNWRAPRGRRVRALSAAYRHRDRLAESERLLVEGTYHQEVSGDREAAIAAYRALLTLRPENSTARHNLAGLLYRSGDFEGAVAEMRRAVESEPGLESFLTLPTYLVDAGRREEGMAVLEEGLARFPENSMMRMWRVGALTAIRDYASADSLAAALDAELSGVDARIGLLGLQLRIDAVRGRLARAEAHLADYVALTERAALWGHVYQAALQMAELSVWSRRDPERAVQEAEELLARYPLADMNVLDRPYLDLAELFARAGQADRAERYLREYEEQVLERERRRDEPAGLTRARGVLALERGRPEEAISLFRESARDHLSGCLLCPVSELAIAFDRAGEADSAIAYYERYLDAPWARRIFWDVHRLPHALERLAQLYAARGEAVKAAARYREFVELWKEADPELQPRVDAARERLARLSASL